MNAKREVEPSFLPPKIAYTNGWISSSFQQNINCVGGEDELVIEGAHLLMFANIQTLTVQFNNKTHIFPLEKRGPFTLIIPVSPAVPGICPVYIEATQTCIPDVIIGKQNTQPLSVQIRKVSFRKRPSRNEPLVTIVTPSFNQGRFIRATIESVLSQDYSNIEYIVVDGGSTDETLDIVHEYSDKLTCISECDNGQSDAINKGFRMANGQIVAWLNSDDVYEPGCISKAVNAFHTYPNAALIYGNGYIIDENGSKTAPVLHIRNFNLWALIHIWDYILQPSTFFKREALMDIGLLREELYWSMDWDLWIRLALHYDAVYIREFLACTREYGETKTATGGEKRLDELLQLMRRYSGDKNPYGYQIYSNWETMNRLFVEIQKETIHQESKREKLRRMLHHPITYLSLRRKKRILRATEDRQAALLALQPTTDDMDRCTAKVNFMVRPNHCSKAISVEVTEDRQVRAVFFYNDQLLTVRTFSRGSTLVELPQEPSGEVTYIRVEIQNKDLKSIRDQSNSWVRMRLID